MCYSIRLIFELVSGMLHAVSVESILLHENDFKRVCLHLYYRNSITSLLKLYRDCISNF